MEKLQKTITELNDKLKKVCEIKIKKKGQNN